MSRAVIPFCRPMSPQEFQQEVRRRAGPGFAHMVIFRDHALDQMVVRGITRVMVMRALQRGTVDARRMKWDEGHGNWTAPIVGIAAGMEIDARCAISSAEQTVVVITAINKGEPR